MTQQTELKDYETMLRELEAFKGEKHLLLGNGFNSSVCVKTGYKEIFSRMKKEHSLYAHDDVTKIMEHHDNDIEKLIGELKKKTSNDSFLSNFIDSKVKYDFMKATYGIVKDNIKKVYQEGYDDIYLLLEKFLNYFTLNYDPLLYLLLMRYERNDANAELVAFENMPLFKEQDFNENENGIHSKIKEAHDNGRLEISVGKNQTPQGRELKKCNKTLFTHAAKVYLQDKGWKDTAIEKVCNLVLEEEESGKKLDGINDGFTKTLEGLVYKEDTNQNVFYLHGSFHIYRDNDLFKKLTQQPGKALYEKLESVINNEEKELTCVLRATREEKMRDIQNNLYLQSGLDKLTALKGWLVIFGSSLDDNDKHIFDAINNSEISVIYVSTSKRGIASTREKIEKHFPKKEVRLFDHKTVEFVQCDK